MPACMEGHGASGGPGTEPRPRREARLRTRSSGIERAGDLIAAGSAMWAVHCALLMAGSLFLAASGGVIPSGVVGAALLLIAALFSALVSSAILAAGALSLRRGAETGARSALLGPASREALKEAVPRSEYAGFSFAAFGIVAFMTIGALYALGSFRPTPIGTRTVVALALATVLWAVASVFLLHAAANLSGALVATSRAFPGSPTGVAPNLTPYALINLVGVVTLAIPLLAAAAAPPLTADLVCSSALGGVVAGLVAPGVGLIAHATAMQFALDLKHAVRARPLRVARPPT